MVKINFYLLLFLLLSLLFACNTSKLAKPNVTVFTSTIEEVEFFNPIDSITLSATFSYPIGLKDFPVAVLISGSGPQNRDSELLGHKPFLVIAEYLNKNGIAVLRYDDRGVAKSEGTFTSATSQDFAKDALSAVRFLNKEKNIQNVGFIGHSEGAMIAQIAAVNNPSVKFIVSLAGPGIPIKELMKIQNRIAIKDMGFSDEEVNGYLDFLSSSYGILDNSTPKEELYDPLKSLVHNYYESVSDSTQTKLAPSKESLYFQLAYAYFSPWFRYFINYDPAENLQKIECPFLALNGELDVQVTADENLEAIYSHLSKGSCPDITILNLDALNHLFQKAVTGKVEEYANIEEDFNQVPLEIIRDWILSR